MSSPTTATSLVNYHEPMPSLLRSPFRELDPMVCLSVIRATKLSHCPPPLCGVEKVLTSRREGILYTIECQPPAQAETAPGTTRCRYGVRSTFGRCASCRDWPESETLRSWSLFVNVGDSLNPKFKKRNMSSPKRGGAPPTWYWSLFLSSLLGRNERRQWSLTARAVLGL